MRPLLASCLLPLSLAAQSIPAAPGVAVGGGATVTSTATGIAFTVPAAFQGAYDTDLSGFAFRNPQGVILGVWGVSSGTIDDVADEIGERLANAGLQLQLAEQPVRAEISTVVFHAVSPAGRGYLVAAFRQGPSGAILAVGALGPDAATLRSTAETMARSAQFGPAEAQQWAQRAAGVQLATSGRGRQYSPGGVGDGSFTSRSNTQLTLCRNGTYGYEMESESYMSVEGVGGMSSEQRDDHQGTWQILADLIGQTFLVLEASDGRSFVWSVQETEAGVVVDGTRYAARQGPC